MANPIILVVTIAIIACSTTIEAFIGAPGIPGVAWGSGTKLCFGFNGLGSSQDEETNEEETEKKISASGLFQMITAGMGAPFLGDYQGVDDGEYYSFMTLMIC